MSTQRPPEVGWGCVLPLEPWLSDVPPFVLPPEVEPPDMPPLEESVPFDPSCMPESIPFEDLWLRDFVPDPDEPMSDEPVEEPLLLPPDIDPLLPPV